MIERVTMTAVAKRAGVHTTTVSLALRNHPSLPVTTRERIQSLAREMGYRPDPSLASLVAYRSRKNPPKHQQTLAYVTNWTTRWSWKKMPAHAQFFAGATGKAAQLGFQLEHFWLGEPDLRHERMSNMLYARGITGVIVVSHRPEAGDELRFDWSRFSGVKIDFYPHQPALHNVTNDQRAIIQLAVRRTVALGYRRIGLVMPQWWDDFVDLAWSAGFLAEQRRLPLKDQIPILIVSDAPADAAASRAALDAWHRQHRPEAIVSYHEFVLPHLAALRLSVPRDVAFVEIFLEKTDGRTAGVRQNCKRVGELAVEILVGKLQQHTFGIPEFATTTLVEGTWFDGKSLPPRR